MFVVKRPSEFEPCQGFNICSHERVGSNSVRGSPRYSAPHLPVSRSPRLPVSPSPRLPVSPSLRLPVSLSLLTSSCTES